MLPVHRGAIDTLEHVPVLIPVIGDRVAIPAEEFDDDVTRVRPNALARTLNRASHARRATLAWTMLVAIASLSHGCSASAVDTQSTIVSGIGIAANAGEPLWIKAYRNEGIAAADHACPVSQLPAQACVDARVAAGRVVTARWDHVRDAWEINAHAQSAYADALDACAAQDAATCPALAAASAALDDTILAFRCAVRAIGHPEVDPLPPPAPLCGASSPSPGGQ